MSVDERCSCGARFKTDEPDAIKLVREWRRKHACIEVNDSVQAVHGGESRTEHGIGFSVQGLIDPARSPEPDWEDE